jgi:hypothetical protein
MTEAVLMNPKLNAPFALNFDSKVIKITALQTT